jgi:hypothetical protein
MIRKTLLLVLGTLIGAGGVELGECWAAPPASHTSSFSVIGKAPAKKKAKKKRHRRHRRHHHQHHHHILILIK